MSDYPPEAWKRLGDLVAKRRQRLDFKQDEAKVRSGGRIARATWSDIERGVRDNYDARTLDGLWIALGWEEDSIERILAGGDPVVARAALIDHQADGRTIKIPITAEIIEEIIALLGDQVSQPGDPERSEQARATLLALQEAIGLLPRSVLPDAPPSPSGS